MEIKKFRFSLLDEDNVQDAFEIYRSNMEYFEICGTKEISLDTIYEDLNSLPERVDKGQKLFGLVYYDDEPIALLDLIKSYPDSDSFYIGLLLIEGSKRGTSYGSNVYEFIEDKMKSLGFKKGRLGVLDNNPKALKFWKKMGYEVINTVDYENQPKRNRTVNIMEKVI